ncbi:hypothetical protein [Actinacidiphila soli]|uniref:hypothetical protein n=1 Tax=Actinacidiphila soli TaxID=2487275 RepID=UPI000FCADFDE|nr:hypothetical protein [Actinacidiphila soli]
MRQDQAVDADTAAAGLTPSGAEVGPLRGEKPKKSPVAQIEGQAAAGAAAGARPKAVVGAKAQQQRGMALPRDLRLRVALAPVSGLWAQLSGGQQQLVGRKAPKALAVLEGLAGPESAPQLLADRVKDRLQEAGGQAHVRDAVGWLLGRALVQRHACSDRRCDDGIRLDTGGDCPNCGNVIHIRRAQRARLAAEVDAALPDVGETEQREVLQDRLRRHAALEAEDLMWRRQQAETEQARRAAAREQARVRAERERLAAQAAEAARRVLPCADCGAQRSAGLCEACGYRRRTVDLVTEAGLVAAVWSAALADQGAVAAVAESVRTKLEADRAAARDLFLELMDPAELAADPSAAASALAFTELQSVQQAGPEYRRCALVILARTPKAEAEAKRAYDTEKGRRHHRWYPDGPIAVAAATRAAEQARERTAQHLLATRLEQLRELTGGRTHAAAPAPWADRLTTLAARSISDDLAGAVIA